MVWVVVKYFNWFCGVFVLKSIVLSFVVKWEGFYILEVGGSYGSSCGKWSVIYLIFIV